MSNLPLRATVRAGALALVALAATAPTVSAAAKPTVTGGLRPFAAQSQTGPHNFLLRGTVKANDATTATRIEYGPTTAYGTSVTAAWVSPTATTEVSATTVSAPATGSTINYRTVATNSVGTTYGPNQEFKVPAGVVRPVYLYPTDRGPSSLYPTLIRNAMRDVQAFYLAEKAKTFTYAKTPITCALPQPSTYYGTVASGQTWNKLEDALTACGVDWHDLYSNIIAFADTPTTCVPGGGSSTGGAKAPWTSTDGSITLSAIGIMDDRHLQGLAGVSNIMDQCYGTPPAPSLSEAQGAEEWKSVVAHEMGHTFGLNHTDQEGGACYQQLATAACQDALMMYGWKDPIGETYLLSREKTRLDSSPFIS